MLKQALKQFINSNHASREVITSKTKLHIIGIAIPHLRKYAKNFVSTNPNWMEGWDFSIYEEVMCYGFCVTYAKQPLNKKIQYLQKYLTSCDSWAHIDVVFTSLKPGCDEMDELWLYAKKLIKSDKELICRAGILIMLRYFLTDKHIALVVDLLSTIINDQFYVKMGLAWTYAEIFIKFCDIGMNILKQKTLDPWVQNKTIQKIRESFRVSDVLKNEILAYKIKTTSRKNVNS